MNEGVVRWRAGPDGRPPPGARDLAGGKAPEATPRTPVSEGLRLVALVTACPDRSMTGCGCNGAVCKARKGDFDRGRSSSLQNCMDCVAGRLGPLPEGLPRGGESA